MDSFHFSEINQIPPEIERICEIVRKALNTLDELCPGYHGASRGVQRLVRLTQHELASNIPSVAPTIEEIIRIRQSMNFCIFPAPSRSFSLESMFERETRRLHESRTLSALLGTPCKTTRETQKKVVERYFRAIDDGKLDKVFSLYADNIQYSRATFHKQGGKIIQISFPPFGDVALGPVPIPDKRRFRGFYESMRDMTGTHTIGYVTNGANGSVISEGSYEGRTSQGKEIYIPHWRDIVQFNSVGKISVRYSLIEKDE